jgi:hypothetical protein
LSGYDDERVKVFQQQFLARLEALPGVQSVSLDREFDGRAIVTLLDQVSNGPKQFGGVPVEAIPATYLETIGTPILAGRNFTTDEVNAKAAVAIVSESTARNLWPGESPLGKLVRLEESTRNGDTRVLSSSAQVIGIARDNQIFRVGQTPPLFFYLPGATPGESDTTLLVRTSTDAAALKDVVRREAYALEPVLRLFVSTFEEKIAKDESVVSAQAASHGATFLGTLALVLASVGIYGVMAWFVVQRTRGNRHSHGPRCTELQRARTRAAARYETGAARDRDRRARVAGCRAVVEEHDVWAERHRRAHGWRGYGIVDRCNAGRVLSARAPRHARRPDRNA